MQSDSAEKPNVLVFFTDQQRWDTVGAYGNPMGLTPNLDRMAQRGTLFRNTFTCQPVCAPARGCIQTGLWATQHGVWRNAISIRPEEKTLAEYFSECGYSTGYVGKWHLADTNDEPVPRELQGGYDYWMASDVLEFTSRPYDTRMYDRDGNMHRFPGYRVDAVTDCVVDYLGNRTDDPFFLYVSYIEPHQQNDLNKLSAPDGYASRYRNPQYVPWDLSARGGDWRRELADYYGMIARLDEALGRVLNTLEEQGILDNTIVLFFSDHGCHFRTRNREYKRSAHEASIRVPFVAQGPHFDGIGEKTELVSLMDMAPTLLSLAGAKVPDYMGGSSVLDLLENNGDDWQDDVFVQISEDVVGRAVRTRRWKYSAYAPELRGWYDPEASVYQDHYLYDLENDPWESTNLVNEPGMEDVLQEMRERLVKRMIRAGEAAPEIIPAG